MRPPFESRVLDAWDAGRHGSGNDRAQLIFKLLDRADLNWPDITVGKRNRELLRAYGDLFGEAHTGLAQCGCGQRLEVGVPALEDLPDVEPATTTIDLDGVVVELRSATCRLVDEARKTGRSVHALAAVCTANAVDDMSNEALSVIDSALAGMDPAATIDIQVVCPECESKQVLSLDTPSFVWTRISAWANQMLDDIHALAMAYGWSEEVVVGLTPLRRRHYLERSQR